MPRLRSSLAFSYALHIRLISIAICTMMLISQTPFPEAKAAAGAAKGERKNASSPRQATPPAPRARRTYRDGEVLVRFRDDAPERGIDALLSVQGARLKGRLRGASRVDKLVIPGDQDPATVAAALRASRIVEFAEPNYLITADQLSGRPDPRFNEQWALHGSDVMGGKTGAGIGVDEIWPLARGSMQTIIAVIDSGVDFSHPDLQANQWRNRRETINTKDDDQNGYADDLSGWDFVTESGTVPDLNGHGTAVAGLIAARGNNGVGISGVMWEAGLLSLRVMDQTGTGDVAAAVEALDYAAIKGAHVINCSWGTSENSAALADAIERAGRQGALVVASAGNHGQNIDAVPYYPAAYDLPNIISVAAINEFNEMSSWSNWGARRVSVAAPGIGMLTTKPGGEYEAVSGSSAAAALTTGVAGLLLTLNRRLTVEQLRTSIVSGVRPSPSLTGKVSAGGVINAGGALNALRAQVATARRKGGSNGSSDGSTNAVPPGVEGGSVGDGDAHRYRVPVQPPARSVPAPWLDLPSLDELRTRQPHEPRAPQPIPSTRFSPGDGARVPQAGIVIPQPSVMLAGLTSEYSSSISAILKDLGTYGLSAPEGNRFGEAGARHVTDAKFGLPRNETAHSESGDAEFQCPGTAVANTKLPIGIHAFQSVDDSAFVSQNVPTSMIAGQPYSVSVTMRNTGTSSWTSAGYGYNLGSQTPQDNQIWGTHRAYLPSTVTVAPGEVYTYSFTITAPSVAGTYNFQWRTVHDGVQWFGAYSNNVAVNVTQSSGTVNGSAFVSQAVPTTMIAGQSYPVSVTMQNTGTVSWTGANLYNLGSHNPQDNQTWGLHRASLVAPAGPGQNGTFNFTVIAPSAPGNYNFQWRTVQDTVEWFGAYSTNISVAVTTGISDSVWVDDTTPAGAVVEGNTDGWNWVSASPAPYSGTLSHRSSIVAGLHQHYFYGASDTLSVNAGDKLYTYVYIDPANVPSELMLQWNDGNWEHRAYWGANIIPWGVDGTESRRYMGALPPAGQWVRLEMSAAALGLEGHTLNGLAFTMYGGRATWDRAGKVAGPPQPARFEPINRVGGSGDDLLSRNFSWDAELLSLKGRSGLNLGLTLAYNSLVWTKDGSTMVFDGDRGDPSPGFRLGFPVIQAQHYNAQAGKSGYMLIMPSGRRVELRATTTANVYESQDSSHLKLMDAGFGLLHLWSTDGTRYTYVWRNNSYRCAEIKDRNGNYITIGYDTYNRLSTIIDTLGRTITFEYDAYHKPIKIKQSWQRQVLSGSSVVTQTETHDWATFGYTNITLQPNFTNLALSGASKGQVIPVLSQVGLADGTRFNFDYSTWGQIYRVTRNTRDDDGIWRPREYVHYNLPQNSGTALTDSPRFTERRNWAENWNVVNNVATEAVTTFSAWDANGASSEVTTPDGTAYKEFYATSGWQKGLVTRTEMRAGGVLKKWTTTAWQHDGGVSAFPVNARPTETNIYDDAGKRKRTSTLYTVYSLPSDIYEYGDDPNVVFRRKHIDYNLNSAYIERRILGLVSAEQLYDGAGALQSKVEYSYDADGDFMQQQGAPIRHDASGYGAGLVIGRGNLTRVRRYDVNNLSLYVDSVTAYNTTGSPIFSRDGRNRQTSISYADKFVNPSAPNDPNSTVNNNTYAYPTTITDADNYSTSAQYNYDLGLVWRTQNPKGAAQRNLYDAAGRQQRITNLVSGFYIRFAYPSSNKHAERFMTLQDGGAEDYYVDFYNGHGQVRAIGGYHSYSQSGWRGQLIEHDTMGRLKRQSQMFEMNGGWLPLGDDVAGYQWTQQSYNWQGRPTVTTNPDGTTKELTYGGCGCAGGQVVTARDEVGRRQRVTSDVLGRAWKTETLLLDGITVYSTKTNTYNVRDQVTRVFLQQGLNGAGQESLTTYDGYGRRQTTKSPIQSSVVSYSYFPDDTVQTVTDPRGATATFTYNNRRMVTNVAYAAPSPIPVPSPVSYSYDEVGNRTGMTDGTGSQSYVYNTLSQITSETRQFATLPGQTYTTTYDYTISGQLKYVHDPSGSRAGYNYDLMGRLLDVTGLQPAGAPNYASNMRYRAWGALKSMTYGNNLTLTANYTGRLQLSRQEIGGMPTQYGGPLAAAVDYQYYADGSPRFADNQVDERFDRAYNYDHAGRLSEAYSGSEARDFVNNTQSGVQTGPYRQSYQHDVWNNLTSRYNRFWSQDDTLVATYDSNSRRQSWQYDTAGNVTQDETLQMIYDAAGRNYQVTHMSSQQKARQWFDGDGQTVKREKEYPGSPVTYETTYYVRSKVLGGQVVTELDGGGQVAKSYVYMGDQVLAERVGTWITWRHDFAITGSRGESYSTSGYAPMVEPDPTGAHVGFEDPFIVIEPAPIEQEMPTFMGGFDQMDGDCQLDGMAISCGMVSQLLRSGAAIIAPTEMVVGIYSRSQGRYVGLAVWNQAAAQAGVSIFGSNSTGFLPAGTHYSQSTGFSGPGWTQQYANYVEHTFRDTWGPDTFSWNGGSSPFTTTAHSTGTFVTVGFMQQSPKPDIKPLPTTEVNNLRSDLEHVLANNTLCAQFMTSFLEQLGHDTGVAPYSTNPLTIFNKIADLGRLFSTDEEIVQERGGGSPNLGTARVEFNLKHIYKSWPHLRVPVILHGVTHAAVSNATLREFSHDQMDEAAYNVLEVVGFGEQYFYPPRPFIPKHSYFAEFIDKNCVRRAN